MSADIKLVRWPDRDRDDFERLTIALARVRATVARGHGDLMSPAVPHGPEEPTDVDRVRALLDQDTARDRAAGSNADLFVNPPWRAMLALCVARGEGRDLSAAALKAGCGALPVAAARWLALIEQRGLIELSGERDVDAVRLTPAGEAFMTECLRVL